MNRIRILFSFAALSVLALGCSTSRVAKTPSAPPVVVTEAAQASLVASQPGWTVVPSGDTL